MCTCLIGLRSLANVSSFWVAVGEGGCGLTAPLGFGVAPNLIATLDDLPFFPGINYLELLGSVAEQAEVVAEAAVLPTPSEDALDPLPYSSPDTDFVGTNEFYHLHICD